MPDRFTVHVHGDDEARRKYAQLELFLEDLRTFWPLLVPVFIGWMRSQFESEGVWGGQEWAPLTPAYALEKARTHPGRTILIRDGDLRRAASEPRREATPRTLTLWIDDPVAEYHQDGTTTMVPRRIIPDPLPPAAGRDVELAAEEYVSTLVRRLEL